MKENDESISYEYVGPKEIFDLIKPELKGTKIEDCKEIIDWIRLNSKITKPESLTVCTFVINMKGSLLIADRHSEHVQCALGENVLGAGEIGFIIGSQGSVKVESITNQSTGYCPSSNCWDEVSKALTKIDGLIIPDKFEPSFTFSYCSRCKQRQIVRDDFYYCAICGEELLSEEDFQNRRSQLTFE